MSNARNISKADSRFVNATGDTISGDVEVLDPVSSSFTSSVKIGSVGSSRRLVLSQDDVLNYSVGGSGTGAQTHIVSGGTAGVGTTRMTIDDSGRVTMPYQPSFFCRPTNGYDISSSTIINGTWYTSPNGWNVGNNFNLSNGVYTAPIAGKYFVHWTALVSQDDARLDFYLTKNGSEFVRSEINGYSATLANRSGAVTAIVDLQVGDNVSFGIRSSSSPGAPNEIYAGNSSPWSYATGYLIG